MAAPPVDSKAPKGNRKEFVRTQVPFAERVSSAVCLALLVAIGVWVWWKGKHFDPGLFALRPDALQSTIEAVEGKNATATGASDGRPVSTAIARSQTSGEGAGYGEAAAAPAPAVKGEPLEIKLAGLQPMGDTEFYSADTLYEKINGRAPAYFSFNFQHLRCRSFSVAGVAGSYVDVHEYRFDTPVNAFGMFALERDPKGAPVDFAPDGYASGMGFFFRQGARYVQIIASDQNPKTLSLAQTIAEDRAKNLPADDAGLDARRRLPATGLDAASVQFVADNAFGLEFLKNIFQGNYDFKGGKISFFIMATKPDEAAAAWKSFLEFSGKFGGSVTPLPDVNGAKIFQAEKSGAWKVIYQRDVEVGGVFDAGDVDKARRFVEEYLQGKLP